MVKKKGGGKMTENEKKCGRCPATTEALGLYAGTPKTKRSEIPPKLLEICERRACPDASESKIAELVIKWIK